MVLARDRRPTREAAQNPTPESDALIQDLTALIPPRPAPAPGHLGFAVPLCLRSEYGDLRLITTLTRFGTAIDVTVAELRMEAFLPADDQTTKALRALDPTTPPDRLVVPRSASWGVVRTMLQRVGV